METIAAISTPIGVGGISMVRVTGDKSLEIAQKIFKAYDGTLLKDMPGYTAKVGRVFYKGKCIDEVVTVVFRVPRSFTGEDIVQIDCHGGLLITKTVLRAFLDAGASMAGPGEFSKRAFLNGKMSLDEAESIMGLISSNYEKDREINFSSYCGNLGKKIESIKNKILDILSDLNVELDYPDEDVPHLSDDEILKSLSNINEEFNKMQKNYHVNSFIRTGIRTAIIGIPNTGKSTLMNLISNREKSIVTDIPGTTRDAIEESVMIGDIPIVLIDTAGIRETDDKIEKIGTERSKEIARSADMVFMVIDASQKISDDEINIIKFLDKKKSIIIINKTDLNNNYNVDIFKDYKVTYMSAKNGTGLEDLSEQVSNLVNFPSIENESLLLSTERQYDIVKKANNKILEVINNINIVPRDILSDMIKESLKILSEFDGSNIENSIVDSIFSKFCVGK